MEVTYFNFRFRSFHTIMYLMHSPSILHSTVVQSSQISTFVAFDLENYCSLQYFYVLTGYVNKFALRDRELNISSILDLCLFLLPFFHWLSCVSDVWLTD